jgi:predicted DNA-binding ribbon-helix-helix protein
MRHPDHHSIRIGTQVSAIQVEPLIWHWLREIAVKRGIPLSHLMEEIDRTHRLCLSQDSTRYVRTLSSAARLFVTEYIATHVASEPRSSRSRSKSK